MLKHIMAQTKWWGEPKKQVAENLKTCQKPDYMSWNAWVNPDREGYWNVECHWYDRYVIGDPKANTGHCNGATHHTHTPRWLQWRWKIEPVEESAYIAIVFTLLSYGMAWLVGWLDAAPSWLEVFAVFTSYSCTWLCVIQKRSNYPIGVISSALYAVLFWQAGLMSSMVLNAYLVLALIYGWLRWGKDTNTRPVTHVSLRMVPVYLATTAVAYGGAVWLSEAFGGTFVWTDSVILVGTILAQFLLDNKKIETWFVWAAVNLFAIYTYGHAALYLVMLQYFVFLINTGIGFKSWWNSMEDDYEVED